MDGLKEVIKQAMTMRAEHIETLAAAFLAQTGSEDAADYTLVEQVSEDGLTRRWWFEHRSETAQREVLR